VTQLEDECRCQQPCRCRRCCTGDEGAATPLSITPISNETKYPVADRAAKRSFRFGQRLETIVVDRAAKRYGELHPLVVQTLSGDLRLVRDWGHATDLRTVIYEQHPGLAPSPREIELLMDFGQAGLVVIDPTMSSDDRELMIPWPFRVPGSQRIRGPPGKSTVASRRAQTGNPGMVMSTTIAGNLELAELQDTELRRSGCQSTLVGSPMVVLLLKAGPRRSSGGSVASWGFAGSRSSSGSVGSKGLFV